MDERDGGVDRDVDLGSGPDQLGGLPRPGLGRRGLLGGLAAGAAGLLLPGLAAAKPKVPGEPGEPGGSPCLRAIRFTVTNRQWGPTEVIEYWANDVLGFWDEHAKRTLARGESNAFYSKRCGDLTHAGHFDAIKISAGGGSRAGWWIQVANYAGVGDPVHYWTYLVNDRGERRAVVFDKQINVNQQHRWDVGGGRDILITRRADSEDHKEFTVELLGPEARGGERGRGRRPRRPRR